MKPGVFATVLMVAVGAGVFGGQMGWQAYSQHKAEAAAAAASAAAAAEAKTPRGLQRAQVLEQLHDASDAQFRNERPSTKGEDTWCGEVNARNRMGAKVGFTRYMVDIKIMDGEVLWASARFDHPDPIGDEAKAAAAGFQASWARYCQE